MQRETCRDKLWTTNTRTGKQNYKQRAWKLHACVLQWNTYFDSYYKRKGRRHMKHYEACLTTQLEETESEDCSYSNGIIIWEILTTKQITSEVLALRNLLKVPHPTTRECLISKPEMSRNETQLTVSFFIRHANLLECAGFLPVLLITTVTQAKR
jgi:hypothetical protein